MARPEVKQSRAAANTIPLHIPLAALPIGTRRPPNAMVVTGPFADGRNEETICLTA
jgi:hypothetical protein